MTRIEWRCSGLAERERERLRRIGERERLLGERGEGDLEYADLGEALFQIGQYVAIGLYMLENTYILSMYFGKKDSLKKKVCLEDLGSQHA